MTQEEAFLKDLTELSKKHKMYIDGCGCCGSPRVEDEDNELLTDLEWDYRNERYIANN